MELKRASKLNEPENAIAILCLSVSGHEVFNSGVDVALVAEKLNSSSGEQKTDTAINLPHVPIHTQSHTVAYTTHHAISHTVTIIILCDNQNTHTPHFFFGHVTNNYFNHQH